MFSFPRHFSMHSSSQMTEPKVCIPFLIPSLCFDLAVEPFHLRALRYFLDLGNEIQIEGKSTMNVYPPAKSLSLLFGSNSLQTQRSLWTFCVYCFSEIFMFRISTSLMSPCVLFFVVSWKISMFLTLKNATTLCSFPFCYSCLLLSFVNI